MEPERYIVAALRPDIHNRAEFDCGVEALNAYLKTRANQEMKARAAACYVMCPESDPVKIAGYYTLSAASVELGRLPVELAKKLPRYDELGVVLIGRLASALDFRGKGVGGKLLMSALLRAYRHSSEIGAVAVVVDAKDDEAASFYAHFGFRPLSGSRMFLPMKEVPKWNPLAGES